MKIRNKKTCYKPVYQCNSEENLKNYKEAKKVAKRAISEARSKAYENLYKRLDTKDGERDIYKLAKARERKIRDLNQMKCIKDENQNVLVNEGVIKERWKEYFAKLFNDGGDTRVRLRHLSNFEGSVSYTFYQHISLKQIRQE